MSHTVLNVLLNTCLGVCVCACVRVSCNTSSTEIYTVDCLQIYAQEVFTSIWYVLLFKCRYFRF